MILYELKLIKKEKKQKEITIQSYEKQLQNGESVYVDVVQTTRPIRPATGGFCMVYKTYRIPLGRRYCLQIQKVMRK